MKLIQGVVAVLETGAGLNGVTVVVFARGDGRSVVRVGSVATDAKGEFRLEVDGDKFIWDVSIEVRAATPKDTVLYADAETRDGAGEVETWTIRIPIATLTGAGLLRPASSRARDLPALGSVVARALANQIRPGLEEAHRLVLVDPRPLEEEIVVPTDALFIEALPAERPLLEDFKLRNRAADSGKAEAEAARARLDNLRRGARILAGDLSDPDIDRKTVVEGISATVVVPGDNG